MDAFVGSWSWKGSRFSIWGSDIHEDGVDLRIETYEKGHLVAKLSVLDHAPMSLADV